MRKKVSFLQSHVAGLQMKLDLVPDFDYASAWFDPGKISPVDRFCIECHRVFSAGNAPLDAGFVEGGLLGNQD